MLLQFLLMCVCVHVLAWVAEGIKLTSTHNSSDSSLSLKQKQSYQHVKQNSWGYGETKSLNITEKL